MVYVLNHDLFKVNFTLLRFIILKKGDTQNHACFSLVIVIIIAKDWRKCYIRLAYRYVQ